MGDTSGGQRRQGRLLPRAWAASMEAESREWMVRCPSCGYERSVWDSGGIRWKASGTSRQFRRCPNCGRRGWHIVYRPRDGAAPPASSRPNMRLVLALAGGGALLAALVLAGVLFAVFRGTAGPRDATNGYFAAVIAGDWPGAQGYLSAAQRARVTPAGLQATWAARESANGPAAGFSVRGTSVKTTTARVSGTLRYQNGASESRTVQLVKEGGAWKIASSP